MNVYEVLLTILLYRTIEIVLTALWQKWENRDTSRLLH